MAAASSRRRSELMSATPLASTLSSVWQNAQEMPSAAESVASTIGWVESP